AGQAGQPRYIGTANTPAVVDGLADQLAVMSLGVLPGGFLHRPNRQRPALCKSSGFMKHCTGSRGRRQLFGAVNPAPCVAGGSDTFAPRAIARRAGAGLLVLAMRSVEHDHSALPFVW